MLAGVLEFALCRCFFCMFVSGTLIRQGHVLAGAAPFMLGERGLKKLLNRKTKVASYNFDLNLIGDYWGWFGKRSYHHTGMISTWWVLS